MSQRVPWLTVSMLVGVGLLGIPVDAADETQVDRARALYNDGEFDEAIAAADKVLSDPGLASAAALVRARARLDRFRLEGEASDLDLARADLQKIPQDRLGPQERVEWEIGVAEALYLEERYGPAAELFGRVLEYGGPLDPRERERLLDWWASALEREAEMQARETRAVAYRRILARMEGEVAWNARSGAAAYWLAAAARGSGDLDRAWNAAVVGWVRASTTADASVLRADLDRLVLQAIIPEQARRRAGSGGDRPETVDAMAALAAEWQRIKASWDITR